MSQSFFREHIVATIIAEPVLPPPLVGIRAAAGSAAPPWRGEHALAQAPALAKALALAQEGARGPGAGSAEGLVEGERPLHMLQSRLWRPPRRLGSTSRSP